MVTSVNFFWVPGTIHACLKFVYALVAKLVDLFKLRQK